MASSGHLQGVTQELVEKVDSWALVQDAVFLTNSQANLQAHDI